MCFNAISACSASDSFGSVSRRPAVARITAEWAAGLAVLDSFPLSSYTSLWINDLDRHGLVVPASPFRVRGEQLTDVSR
jgi:hypothetical protein